MSSSPTLSIDAYLERIGISSTLIPIRKDLEQLIRAHVTHIPFENISVLNDREISLEIPDLFQKIVRDKRGGYCFELNTLFEFLLNSLGFSVTPWGARVVLDAGDWRTRPRTHKILKVDLEEEEWLVDVTFGGMGLAFPIALDPSESRCPTQSHFRITRENELEFVEARREGKWNRLYGFTRETMFPIDYRVANFYTSKYPGSLFRHQLLALRYAEEAQFMIRGNEWIRSDGVKRETRIIASRNELHRILERDFLLEIDPCDLRFFPE